jgi:catechol 2,3-dioxygenase-like lactoylglutathione lyase family enzyme
MNLINGTVFSHGTMDCRDAAKTQKFLTEFLGLRSVRKSEGTQYVWLGGRWFVACLCVGEKVPPRQGEDYRFALAVATPGEVEAAHHAALAQKDKWEIREVKDVTRDGDTISFNLRDLNGVWWEIYHRPGRLYDDIFA